MCTPIITSYVTDRPPPTSEVRPTPQSENAMPPTTPVPSSDAPSSGSLEVQSETREVVQSTAVQRDINLPTSTETPTRNLSSHNKGTTMVTPEELRPFLKVPLRKQSGKGRKPGRTKIATDTTEKHEVRREKEKKNEKELNKKQKLTSNKVQTMNKKKNKPAVKQYLFESDSDSDNTSNDNFDSDAEIETYAGLLEQMNGEIYEQQEEEMFERVTFDYVLVRFQRKCSKPEHYVGQILSKDSYGFEYQIKFYKRIQPICKFVEESAEIFDVSRNSMFHEIQNEVKRGFRGSSQDLRTNEPCAASQRSVKSPLSAYTTG
ncbi:hypothetical protein J6590_089818 [Homalodisca vitripennis]|nr:hypothetical protein J6590_089818 [Homalodisca vitripennis]